MKFDFKQFSFKNIINKYYILLAFFLSCCLNGFIELFARLSVTGCIKFILSNPLIFLYNVILIFFTFSIALLSRKRCFSMLLVTILWVAMGITNSFLLFYRRTPFIAADFLVIRSALDIMDIYLSKLQMAATALAIFAALVSLFFILIKEKKKKVNYKCVIIILLISAVTSFVPSKFLLFKNTGENRNITDDANNYGFVCCFLNSIFNSGIEKPDEYSEYKMDIIKDKISGEKNTENGPLELPNIIAVQLESFVDPYKIPGSEYSEDPIPNFRKYKEKYSSGLLNVPVYGGGTANTEFEVLTGMNVKYFGVGEYPYETVLSHKTLESVCYNLKEHNYKTHALHNHTGTFYERNKVYSHLGFDTFTPIEYMNDVEKNTLSWAKSGCFTQQVIEALDSTKEKDFLFVVTSQCHGRYPDTYDKNNKIKASGSPKISNSIPELEFYANSVNEEDVWLGEFIESLYDYDEPIIAVVYGDHMPSFSLNEGSITNKAIYQTEYFIWTNYYNNKEDKELSTYNLMSDVLKEIGINTGIVTKFHQYGLKNDNSNLDELYEIQYDMIYGRHYLYEDHKIPYKPTDMMLGYKPVEITDVTANKRKTKISGKNFTPSSVVFVDENEVKTTFIDKNTLSINSQDCENYKELVVSQKAANLTILGSSAPYKNPKK